MDEEAGENIMNRYPTREKILEAINIKPGAVKRLMKWKEKWYKGWDKKDEDTKYEAIIELVKSFSKKANTIRGLQYRYLPALQLIEIDSNNYSIISTLHELAHHLFGPEELYACQWSIQLFMICFPRTYQKLKWQGHLLVKS